MYNENESSYRIVKDSELYTDISCDYVLPDYLGEVRKILLTEARVLPLPTYMSGDDACSSGTVHFKMVYTDAENKLTTAEFSEDYEMSRGCEEGFCAIGSDTELDGYSMRLLGPRKISAKARVETKLTTVQDRERELSGSAVDSGEAELATAKVMARDFMKIEPQEREYAEELAFFEGAICDEVEIPYHTAETTVSECRAKDGEIWVSGEHRIYAIVIISGGAPLVLRKSIPFAESFVSEGAGEDMKVSADARVSSLKISENPSDTGTSVTASLICEYSPTAEHNRALTIVTDGYMKDREVEAEYSPLELEEISACEIISDREEHTVSASQLGLENARELLYVTADAKIKSVDISEKMMRITSDVRFSGIACEVNENSTQTLVQIKHSVECTKNVNITCQNHDNLTPELKLSASGASGYIDGDACHLSADLCYGVRTYEKKCYKVLSRLEATDRTYDMGEGKKIYVYYPDESDTLFSVARKFHTTPEKIAAVNALTEAAVADVSSSDSLRGVGKLVIK